jgi:hypothetical protein
MTSLKNCATATGGASHLTFEFDSPDIPDDFFNIFSSFLQRPGCNIFAIVSAIEFYLAAGFVGAIDGGLQIGSASGDAQDSTSRSVEIAIVLRCAGVKDVYAFGFYPVTFYHDIEAGDLLS